MATPTWKDTYLESTANKLTFSVSRNGEVIYTGQAQKPYTDAYIHIRMNDICEPYLSPLFDGGMTLLEGTHNAPAISTFTVTSDSSQLGTFTFAWCRDTSKDSITDMNFLNTPVDSKTTAGMFHTSTYAFGDNYSTTFTRDDGNGGCGRYAIYYVNLKGGWDYYLFEGGTTRRQTYTTVETANTYNNNTLARGAGRLIPGIQDEWTLNTSYMNDRKSLVWALNIPTSPCVYLHDLAEDTVTPVIITDTDKEIRHHTAGNMNAYSLTVRRCGSTIKQS